MVNAVALKHTTCRHMVFDAAAAIDSQHCNRSDRYNNIGPRNVLARSWAAVNPDAGWESMRTDLEKLFATAPRRNMACYQALQYRMRRCQW